MEPSDKTTTLELNHLLDLMAAHLVELGTRTESPNLQTLAAATQDRCPGAASALVDWEGTEIARLRAFGIVHGVVLRDLPPGAQLQLLLRLRGTADLALAV